MKNLSKPANAQVTSTEQNLKTGPADRPNWPAGMGRQQVTSSQIPLSRTPYPVANLENKPGMGQVQVTSTKCDLSRQTNSLYGPGSKTTPETPLKKR